MDDLLFRVNGKEIKAGFLDKNPDTKASILDSLPVRGEASKWGDELYFETSIDIEPEETQEIIPVGGVAYWPSGNAICIFWGETPASETDEPRAAGPVNVFALLEDTEELEGVGSGVVVEIEEL